MCNILQISYTNCDKEPLCRLKGGSKRQNSNRMLSAPMKVCYQFYGYYIYIHRAEYI